LSTLTRNLFIITRSLIFSGIMVLFAGNPVAAQEILTLQQALETGLKNNFSIILQKNEERIAANDNTPGNAGFLPSVELSASQDNTVTTTHQEQFSGTTKDVANAMNNNLNVDAQLNWTLFDGMNMFVNKKMLGIMEDLGQNGTRIVVEGTVADIVLTYYGIIQLRKLVHVAQDAVDLSMQRKRIAAAKVSLGAGSQLMLLQSTVDLNADSTRLIQEMVALANTCADLNRLLARDVMTPFEINDTILIREPLPFDTILRKAHAQNATLTAARLNQDLTRLGVNEAEADRYPRLTFTGGYSFSTLNSKTGFLQYNRSYGPYFGISLNYSLFNGFNVNRAVKNAKIAMNSGEIEVKDATESLNVNLLKQYNQFRSNLEVVRLQLSNVIVARENVNIAFEKYKLGSINDIELREIQQKLIDAEYQLISSQFDCKKAEVELMRLSGEILRFKSFSSPASGQ